jgi:hypothetical protein
VSFWAITTGRSGSTTLARLLAHTPGIDAVHEPYPSLFFEGRLAIEGNALPLDHAARLLHATRGWMIEGSIARGRLPFDASPLMSHLAAPIRHAFGDARFVHLVRSPRAFARSALGGGWCRDDSPMADAWPRPPDPTLAPWQRVLWLWGEVHRQGLALERELGPEVVHRVAMEDLVRDPDAFKALLAWIGVPPEQVEWARGPAWQTIVRSRNPSPSLPPWEPAWDSFLERVAGDVIAALEGRRAVTTGETPKPPLTALPPEASVAPTPDPGLAGELCRLLDVAAGDELCGATIVSVAGGEIALAASALPAGPLHLSVARPDGAPCYARSGRFAISYRSDGRRRLTPAEAGLLDRVVARLREKDPLPR